MEEKVQKSHGDACVPLARLPGEPQGTLGIAGATHMGVEHVTHSAVEVHVWYLMLVKCVFYGYNCIIVLYM